MRSTILLCALFALLLAATHVQASSCIHRRAAARAVARAAVPRVSGMGHGSCRVDTTSGGHPDVEVESCSNRGNGVIRLRIEADYYCQRNGRWTDVYYYIIADVDTRNNNRVTRWVSVRRGYDDK